MLSKEQEFYETNKEKFRELYLNKRIVISDGEVKGAYNSDTEALTAAPKTMKPGSFMIKLVTATDEEPVQRYYSRVYV